MIVVRNVFQLKFGKAREALPLVKQGLEINRKAGVRDSRVLTDLVGRFYTVVLEMSFTDLAELERSQGQLMTVPEWKAWYDQLVPLVESGYREIFHVVA
jgi:hypothetical protein